MTASLTHVVSLARIAGVLTDNKIHSVSAEIYGESALLTFGSFADAWHALFILQEQAAVNAGPWNHDPPRIIVSLL